MIILSAKQTFKVPVDAENVTPDVFAGKTVDEIKALKIWEGNRERTLGELFTIEHKEDVQDDYTSIRIVGDLTKVKRIGAEMSQGKIMIEGNVGMRLGEGMQGGTITVKGNADSWAGMMIKGGNIEIIGNASDYLGAAYRGSTVGMTGGKIVVHGDAGNEVGCFMNDGLIIIRGNVKQFVGMHMCSGTILIEGDSEGRVGAQMTGGKIVVLGRVPSILPSTVIDEIRKTVKVNGIRIEGPFYLFRGDVTESWKGSIYIYTKRNPHLKIYEDGIV